jgi:hypothetical protein
MSSAEEAKLEIEPSTAIVLVGHALEKGDAALAERMFRSVSRNREYGFHAYRHMIRHYYFASRLNEFDATFMEMINNKIKIPTGISPPPPFLLFLFFFRFTRTGT